MRAAVIREPGGPEVLEIVERPAPDVPFHHLRVAVRFAGVNRADLLQRAGFYPAPPGVPADVPGLEYAGVVEAVGSGATRFKVGDRVFGLVAGGAYAERVIAHEREAVAIPPSLTDEQAASIPEAFVTAYDALRVRGRLEPGDAVLVTAAGSGVGTAGVQIARAFGCRVLGTSRTAEKLEKCRALGLDVAIEAPSGAFRDAVLAATGRRGVDVVLELVGGAYIAEDVRACAPRARIVVVGLTAGARAELEFASILGKRIEIIGTSLRSRPLEEKIEAAQLLERRLVPWFASGKLEPVVDRVFPFAQVAEAHRYVASNVSFGKVLLAVTEG